MILTKILLLLSLFNPSDSVDHIEIAPVQQVISSEVVITDSLFTDPVGLDFGSLNGWKFSPQDNPEFSSPDYDDSHWYMLEKTPFTTIKLPDSLWQGFGWLRLRIRIDSSFSKTLNVIYPGYILGASELYINGSIVMSHGVPGVTPGEQKLLGYVIDFTHRYEFLPGKTYQIAIKYSLHNLSTIRRITMGNLRTPFLLDVVASNYESLGELIENSIILTSILIFAVTILLLVMLLHLFMYLYVSEKNANFAILVLSACLFLLSVTMLSQSFSIRNFWVYIILTFSATNILVIICGSLVPWVTYRVLDVPIPLFWKRFVLIPLFLLLFLAFFSDFISKSSDFIFMGFSGLLWSLTFIPSATGSILAIIKARKMKKKGIGIVAGSLLVYPFVIIIMLIVSIFVSMGYVGFIAIFITLISMPVGMSIQQAKKFLHLHLQLDFLVKERTAELSKSLNELKSTQSQLIASEKLASLGALTAGIAHEIQNPLNFVNNFSDVNQELLEELKEELAEGSKQYLTGNMQLGMEKIKSAGEIANDVIGNEQKINHHGKRAESIVKGMLLHSRGSSGHKEPTDINALADEYLRLSYHGFRAKDKSFNADFKTDFDPNLPQINVVPQDIGRVLLNLINNAFYAVQVKTHGGASLQQTPTPHKPTVTVSTQTNSHGIEISVKDNGPGIPDTIKDKIFQPFFTTKPTGQGTGLGLSMAYDIVKAHGGEIRIESKNGEGTEFIVQLPIF